MRLFFQHLFALIFLLAAGSVAAQSANSRSLPHLASERSPARLAQLAPAGKQSEAVPLPTRSPDSVLLRCRRLDVSTASLSISDTYRLAACLDGNGAARLTNGMYRSLAHEIGDRVDASPISRNAFVRTWLRVAAADLKTSDLTGAQYALTVASKGSAGTPYANAAVLLSSDLHAAVEATLRHARELEAQREAQRAAEAAARDTTDRNSGVATEFDSEEAAQAHCPSDTVVWLNTNSGIYHYSGERWYGNTNYGAYVCEREAISAGNRATENGQ